MKNLAIIPARAGSKRIFNKNLKDFDGQPLFLRAMLQAKSTGLFSKIHLSTDSIEMKKIAEFENFSVEFMRPEKLANDTTQLNEVIKHVISSFSANKEHFDNACLIWPTSPLRQSSDISQSYKLLTDETSSVLSVTEYPISIFSSFFVESGYLNPVYPDMLRERSSNQRAVVCCNSSICWFKVHEYDLQGHWLMDRSVPYHMPKAKSVDIDDEDDWKLAISLLAANKESKI